MVIADADINRVYYFGAHVIPNGTSMGGGFLYRATLLRQLEQMSALMSCITDADSNTWQ